MPLAAGAPVWVDDPHFSLDYHVRHSALPAPGSDEQLRYARELCKGTSVDVRKCDYRDLEGTYDKVAVIAVLSHFGHKNHRFFMEKVYRHLAPEQHAEAHSLAVERHHALNWLCGAGESWDDVPLDT